MDARERALRNGIETLTNDDLLAVVLGTGTRSTPVNRLARSLMEHEGGLSGLARSSPHGLLLQHGVGAVKATRLCAAFELGRRAHLVEMRPREERLVGYSEVVAWAQPRLATLEHEEVWLLSLDGQNALKSARKIAQGGAHGCALTTRDVLSPALRDRANAIVLVHNHPSGNPNPSREDIEMTRSLARACDVVGLPLFDHVIVAREGSSSLAESFAP